MTIHYSKAEEGTVNNNFYHPSQKQNALNIEKNLRAFCCRQIFVVKPINLRLGGWSTKCHRYLNFFKIFNCPVGTLIAVNIFN